MTVGLLRLCLFMGGSKSLKEKRMILHSLKARLRNNFNIAVAQIGDEDKWQRATLAIVGVEKNRSKTNSVLSGIINFLEGDSQVNLIDYEMEFI